MPPALATNKPWAALKQSGFDRIYPDLQQFCLDEQVLHGRANKLQVEAVRCNPRVIGYCVHALTGGDWIMGAGLIDLWRNPKTYVYVAGLRQISGLLDEALVKIVGSPEQYEQQKAKMIEEGRWAELIY